MKKSRKRFFVCQKCGLQNPRWMGRCPECGGWDTFIEEVDLLKGPSRAALSDSREPVPINQIDLSESGRIRTGICEFDRVLGGGLVPGSLVLIGGDPGIGKSTLMLQVLNGLGLSGHRLLYVSGEESIQQIRLRSRRINAESEGISVFSEVNVDAILDIMEERRPDVVVADSIQTLYSPELNSAPGSVSQVRESAMKLMMAAKRIKIPVFLVGHVTKEGAIAGPRLLEHMVDTVLYFEGDKNHVFRILRAVKNRFGSTNEIGVFEMEPGGLKEVASPSLVFLAERGSSAPGSVVTACVEGSRPLLVELQALASRTYFGTPRRTILGLDQNRVSLLAAVMEKRLGFQLNGHDLFMNVAGGIKVDEPAVDLGIVAAISSSFLDRPLSSDMIVFGEVGLTGEVRGISHPEPRVMEARKMGFERCLMPRANKKQISPVDGIRIIDVSTLSEAVEYLF